MPITSLREVLSHDLSVTKVSKVGSIFLLKNQSTSESSSLTVFRVICKNVLEGSHRKNSVSGNPVSDSLAVIDVLSHTLFRRLHLFYQAQQIAFIFK